MKEQAIRLKSNQDLLEFINQLEQLNLIKIEEINGQKELCISNFSALIDQFKEDENGHVYLLKDKQPSNDAFCKYPVITQQLLKTDSKLASQIMNYLPIFMLLLLNPNVHSDLSFPSVTTKEDLIKAKELFSNKRFHNENSKISRYLSDLNSFAAQAHRLLSKLGSKVKNARVLVNTSYYINYFSIDIITIILNKELELRAHLSNELLQCQNQEVKDELIAWIAELDQKRESTSQSLQKIVTGLQERQQTIKSTLSKYQQLTINNPPESILEEITRKEKSLSRLDTLRKITVWGIISIPVVSYLAAFIVPIFILPALFTLSATLLSVLVGVFAVNALFGLTLATNPFSLGDKITNMFIRIYDVLNNPFKVKMEQQLTQINELKKEHTQLINDTDFVAQQKNSIPAYESAIDQYDAMIEEIKSTLLNLKEQGAIQHQQETSAEKSVNASSLSIFKPVDAHAESQQNPDDEYQKGSNTYTQKVN